MTKGCACHGERTVFWTDKGRFLHAAFCPELIGAINRGTPIRSYDYCPNRDDEQKTYPPASSLLHKCLDFGEAIPVTQDPLAPAGASKPSSSQPSPVTPEGAVNKT